MCGASFENLLSAINFFPYNKKENELISDNDTCCIFLIKIEKAMIIAISYIYYHGYLTCCIMQIIIATKWV
jgi:hypothetical protein